MTKKFKPISLKKGKTSSLKRWKSGRTSSPLVSSADPLPEETLRISFNMVFIHHYRCRENVLRRPILAGGNSYALTGHHEIMFPILAVAVMEKIKKQILKNNSH